ncbi:hypothetical protein [Campylobacter majalis]|uniref:hypothetical protein n=1 Tax=Campylobacter majalis TaxID=2790656 RepID=UPI003D69C26D
MAAQRTKMIELLHKQLIRKGRARRENLGDLSPFGECYIIKDYDIKSPSTAPYNYNSKDDLGLNQFFVGQNPYKPYKGDPKKGIYHDTSKIVPKRNKMSGGGYALPVPEKDKELIQSILVSGYLITIKYYIYETNDRGARRKTDKTRTIYEVDTDAIAKDWGKILKTSEYTLDQITRYICKGGFVVEVAKPVAPSGDRERPGRDAYYRVYPIFSKEHNMPICGAKKWIEKWEIMYDLYVDEDNDFEAFLPIISIAVVVATYFTGGATAGAWGAIASGTATLAQIGAVSTFLGIVGLNFTLIGSLTGKKGLVKIGRVVGFIGAIGSIYTAAKEFFFQGAAKATASSLPNSTIAGMQGMGQTTSLYSGIGTNGFANATYATTSASSLSNTAVGVSNTNSVMFSTNQNAFASALAGHNVGAGVLSANTSQLYLTQALNIAKIGYKSYSLVQNIRGAFREANQFNDEDMNEQGDEEKQIGANTQEQENENDQARRFYERDVEYDLGLEGGTLMSNDDSLLNL